MIKYKLRIVDLAGGECRIQKKHWLLTFGFWITVRTEFGLEYWQGSKEKAEYYVTDYYKSIENNKIIGYR